MVLRVRKFLSRDLEFEQAAQVRDEIKCLKELRLKMA
jgi:protein-arginine kinase activator protein McsA